MDRNGYNPSIYPVGYCHICGSEGDLIRHEIFGGSRRQLSKRLGLWVNLCPACHHAVHSRPERFYWLKREAELKAREDWGWSAEQFREAIGKNYL